MKLIKKAILAQRRSVVREKVNNLNISAWFASKNRRDAVKYR